MARSIALLAALTCGSIGLGGCPGDDTPADAAADASCTMGITVGTGSMESFRPLHAGDPIEVILGFQGFRMLDLTLRIEEPPERSVYISAFVDVVDTDVEVRQLPTPIRAEVGPDGAAYVEGFLVFFNDAPIADLVNHDADLELVVRERDCTGGQVVRVQLRDDVACVDYDASVPDAGYLDGGVPDGAVACGVSP